MRPGAAIDIGLKMGEPWLLRSARTWGISWSRPGAKPDGRVEGVRAWRTAFDVHDPAQRLRAAGKLQGAVLQGRETQRLPSATRLVRRLVHTMATAPSPCFSSGCAGSLQDIVARSSRQLEAARVIATRDVGFSAHARPRVRAGGHKDSRSSHGGYDHAANVTRHRSARLPTRARVTCIRSPLLRDVGLSRLKPARAIGQPRRVRG